GFAAIVVLGLLGLSVLGQSNRPRVATTPTPPIIQNDPLPPGGRTGGPPVLGSRNGPSSPNPTASPTPPTGATKEDEIVKVETNLVTMPVSVLDKDGRFISGLLQKDFQIFEDNVQQKVEYFASVETPFTVVMLLDVSPSTQWQIEDIQNAA